MCPLVWAYVLTWVPLLPPVLARRDRVGREERSRPHRARLPDVMRIAALLPALLLAACGKEEKPVPGAARPVAANAAPATSAPTAAAPGSAAPTASAAPSASAPAAPAALPGYACPDPSVWIPSGVRLGTGGCPVYSTRKPLPPLPIKASPCDPIAPGDACTYHEGSGRIDASTSPPLLVRVEECREYSLLLVAELDGKVVHGVATRDVRGDAPGRCELSVAGVGGGHLAGAILDYPSDFSPRTGSPTLALFGGPIRGPYQLLVDESFDGHPLAAVGTRGYGLLSYGTNFSGAWGRPGKALRVAGNTFGGSVERGVIAGGALAVGDNPMPVGMLGGEAAVAHATGGWVRSIAADDAHLAWTVEQARTHRFAFLAAPAPEDETRLAPLRYAVRGTRVTAVGCGHALLDAGGKALELVRLGDGATALLPVTRADHLGDVLTCKEAILSHHDGLHRLPLSAFGALEPPSEAPVPVAPAQPFDAADADAPDAGGPDAGSVDAGSPDAGSPRVPASGDAGAGRPDGG